MSDAELPKHELLIKLMGMTSSSSDGEALVAIRKANQLLKSAGWDWERVLKGKIKVVGNPFVGNDNPFERKVSAPPAAAQPSWKPTPQPTPQQPKKAPPPKTFHYPTSAIPLSTVRNRFADFCYCCGKDTPAQQGWLFDPWNFVPLAQSKWRVACNPCNTMGAVGQRPAPPIRTKKASVTDLA